MEKISCITVTKNRVPFLEKSISYFINQTYENKEMVIVYYNTDKITERYLKDNQDYLNGNNIFFYKIIEDEGIFLGAIRNFGISKATGDWIVIWDDDDYYTNNRLESQYNYCIDNNLDSSTLKCILVYSERYQETKCSFERAEGWEGSLICKKDIMPKYKNIKKGEDTPVLMYLVFNNNFGAQFNPDLYVYLFHDTNTSGSRHKEELWDNSFPLNARKNREVKQVLGWI